ncbi:putative transcriptional regulator [Hyphomicrobium denitrificans ATCC 51888]|uniref:Putative transcriptional regulator n=1 Tax=Hyphomicrobium denitrificans (strain ATCC 51888 / DSM 1869 / NCIMB 11706 / TK 0415) TaxID=582899 RepID=D8JVE0_HYPDA|nr:putative transcriptional regulator [Hyphomicrobium denitrificans ATCC 51888]
MAVIASIRDKRGAVSILDWVRACGGADTVDIAARFAMSTDAARKHMKQLQRDGLVRSRPDTYSFSGRQGGPVLMWEALSAPSTDAKDQP